jgi:hypothetical protein
VADLQPSERLKRWEWVCITLFLLLPVAFGFLVEYRSAFLRRRMGDLGCYLRASWAIRAGVNLYDVVEDNAWHYNYPPLYAILLYPLGDPPSRDLSYLATRSVGMAATPGGAGPLLAATTLAADATPLVPDVGWTVPYAVSVAICYLLNVFFLGLAVHWLASALEQSSLAPPGKQPWTSRRWWLLRTVPIITCFPAVGHTLMRGQANTLLLAMICGMVAGLMRGRSFRAGLCLAGAICLKIFPAYLGIVPLIRRDRRCLAGCAVGLVVGLILVPVAVMGPQRTGQAYADLAKVLVGPALRLGGDDTRAAELILVTSTDSQSFLAMIHNTIHLDRDHRPAEATPEVRHAHWLLAAGFTLITLAIGWKRRNENGPAVVLLVGCLTLVMVLTSPVCHTHYFMMAIPMVAGLLVCRWESRRWTGEPLGVAWVALIAAQIVGTAIPLLPNLDVLKDVGLMTYVVAGLWLLSAVRLIRGSKPARMPAQEEGEQAAQAA